MKEHLDVKHGLKHHLTQILNWKSNLDKNQKKRKRKDSNDRATVQSIQFWLNGYLNGLHLQGWI